MTRDLISATEELQVEDVLAEELQAGELQAGEGAAGSEQEGSAVQALRKKDLIADVAERTGQKKALAREMVEAVLQSLGEAIDAHEALSIAPLGTIRKIRSREGREGASQLTLKLRRPPASKARPDEAAEGDATAGGTAGGTAGEKQPKMPKSGLAEGEE